MTSEPLWEPADTATRLDAQQKQIESLSRHLQAINDAVMERVTSDNATAPCLWEDLPAEEAHDRWRRLRGWVDWLRDRYALDTKAVPWCWYLHGALIEELTGLWTAHLAAFGADADPGGPANWHDTLARTLPRLREWAGRTGCKPGEHHDDITAEPGEPEDCWSLHLAGQSRCSGANENSG